jgi:hypothetical protein
MLDLLLLGNNLLVKQINLLGGYGFIVGLGLFPWRGGLASNIVEGFFAICAKLGVFEFPCLWILCETSARSTCG